MKLSGGFEFDEPTRIFIKKIRSRKFIEPEPLHENLATLKTSVAPTSGNYCVVNVEEMKKCGWIKI